jgi:hypothetical protein
LQQISIARVDLGAFLKFLHYDVGWSGFSVHDHEAFVHFEEKEGSIVVSDAAADQFFCFVGEFGGFRGLWEMLG